MSQSVGLKELRQNAENYIKRVQRGESFIVTRRARPIFKISPPQEKWEVMVDFTKLRKDGVSLEELLRRL